MVSLAWSADRRVGLQSYKGDKQLLEATVSYCISPISVVKMIDHGIYIGGS